MAVFMISTPALLVSWLLLVTLSSFDVTSTYEIQSDKISKTPLQLRTSTAAHKLELLGNLFDSTGCYRHLLNTVETSVVHWLSPFIENEAKRKFLGPPYENEYFANAPAITFYKDDLVLVAKVWLDRRRFWEDSDDIHLNNKRPPQRNNFNDNWLYHQRFDSSVNPIIYSSLLGIPAPSQYKYNDGPSDPRLFELRGELYLLFNMGMALNVTMDINYPVLWDFRNTGPIWIEIEGGSPFWKQGANFTKHEDGIIRDKHWIPLVDNNELYMIYTLDPLRVMKCILTEVKCFCKFIPTLPRGPDRFRFTEKSAHLRGGTPFIKYDWPYYVSIGHSVFYASKNSHQNEEKHYKSHLVVISVAPTVRIVYVSGDIEFNSTTFEYAPQVDKIDAADNYLLPVGLIVEDADTLCVGFGINNRNSLLARIRGVQSLMQGLATADNDKKPDRGPPPHSVQDTIHLRMSTKYPDLIFAHE